MDEAWAASLAACRKTSHALTPLPLGPAPNPIADAFGKHLAEKAVAALQRKLALPLAIVRPSLVAGVAMEPYIGYAGGWVGPRQAYCMRVVSCYQACKRWADAPDLPEARRRLACARAGLKCSVLTAFDARPLTACIRACAPPCCPAGNFGGAVGGAAAGRPWSCCKRHAWRPAGQLRLALRAFGRALLSSQTLPCLHAAGATLRSFEPPPPQTTDPGGRWRGLPAGPVQRRARGRRGRRLQRLGHRAGCARAARHAPAKGGIAARQPWPRAHWPVQAAAGDSAWQGLAVGHTANAASLQLPCHARTTAWLMGFAHCGQHRTPATARAGDVVAHAIIAAAAAAGDGAVRARLVAERFQGTPVPKEAAPGGALIAASGGNGPSPQPSRAAAGGVAGTAARPLPEAAGGGLVGGQLLCEESGAPAAAPAAAPPLLVFHVSTGCTYPLTASHLFNEAVLWCARKRGKYTGWEVRRGGGISRQLGRSVPSRQERAAGFPALDTHPSLANTPAAPRPLAPQQVQRPPAAVHAGHGPGARHGPGPGVRRARVAPAHGRGVPQGPRGGVAAQVRLMHGLALLPRRCLAACHHSSMAAAGRPCNDRQRLLILLGMPSVHSNHHTLRGVTCARTPSLATFCAATWAASG